MFHRMLGFGICLNKHGSTESLKSVSNAVYNCLLTNLAKTPLWDLCQKDMLILQQLA